MAAVILLVTGRTAFSSAPELRNVMPNSWEKITRLSIEEEAVFLDEHQADINKEKASLSDGWAVDVKFKPDFSRVYKQETGSFTFYRVILLNDESPDFYSESIRFVQLFFFNDKRILRAYYNSLVYSERIGTESNFETVDVIEGNGRVNGVLHTHVHVRRQNENNNRWDRRAYRKGQLFGLTSMEFFPMENIVKFTNSPGNAAIPRRELLASNCLVDPQTPLKYSLQNAFDGNPATSYVENTDDDLMQIYISFPDVGVIREVMIINGYAQSRELYHANNRVRSFSAGVQRYDSKEGNLIFVPSDSYTLQDNELSPQFVEIIESAHIAVTAIYPGSTYGDTCIAEINFRTADGWMFGEP
jgi:hypothetical protein